MSGQPTKRINLLHQQSTLPETVKMKRGTSLMQYFGGKTGFFPLPLQRRPGLASPKSSEPKNTFGPVNSPLPNSPPVQAAAAVVNPPNLPNKLGTIRYGNNGYQPSGETLKWFGRPRAHLYVKSNAPNGQRYVYHKTKGYMAKIGPWSIQENKLVWTGKTITPTTNAHGAAIGTIAGKAPVVVNHVKIANTIAQAFAQGFKQTATNATTNKVLNSNQVSEAVKNAIQAPTTPKKVASSAIANKIAMALYGVKKLPPTPSGSTAPTKQVNHLTGQIVLGKAPPPVPEPSPAAINAARNALNKLASAWLGKNTKGKEYKVIKFELHPNRNPKYTNKANQLFKLAAHMESGNSTERNKARTNLINLASKLTTPPREGLLPPSASNFNNSSSTKSFRNFNNSSSTTSFKTATSGGSYTTAPGGTTNYVSQISRFLANGIRANKLEAWEGLNGPLQNAAVQVGIPVVELKIIVKESTNEVLAALKAHAAENALVIRSSAAKNAEKIRREAQANANRIKANARAEANRLKASGASEPRIQLVIRVANNKANKEVKNASVQANKEVKNASAQANKEVSNASIQAKKREDIFQLIRERILKGIAEKLGKPVNWVRQRFTGARNAFRRQGGQAQTPVPGQTASGPPVPGTPVKPPPPPLSLNVLNGLRVRLKNAVSNQTKFNEYIAKLEKMADSEFIDEVLKVFNKDLKNTNLGGDNLKKLREAVKMSARERIKKIGTKNTFGRSNMNSLLKFKNVNDTNIKSNAQYYINRQGKMMRQPRSTTYGGGGMGYNYSGAISAGNRNYNRYLRTTVRPRRGGESANSYERAIRELERSGGYPGGPSGPGGYPGGPSGPGGYPGEPGGAPLPPSGLTSVSQQRIMQNLTPNQKEVVNNAGNLASINRIFQAAGGPAKVSQAAQVLKQYTPNQAVKMRLTTSSAIKAVNTLGGPNKVAAAVVVNQKIITAKKRRRAAKKAKVPESPPIRAQLLKSLVKKFTKNNLVKIAGENALGTKNNKNKNTLVKNFTKYVRRQPKGKKKGSVPVPKSKKAKMVKKK